ncbi:MAG: spermidine synthase, partial [Myxococcota bacterium]|nr:spermidine synthase [Myxococcota bacterium]
MRPSTRTISVFLFGSGFAALVYQTAWQRMLRLVFGASTGATAAVLGIFLGGLGLGGLLLGRRVERSPKPLSFYANLEVGIAIAAALSPLLVDLCGALYFKLGGSRTLGWSGATLARLVLAALVMGPAVVLMGGTLPAAARAVEGEGDVGRGRLAVLYTVNTAGAVAGALLATFFLFEAFGTRLALWLACLVNLLVAVTARAVGRGAPALEVSTPRAEAIEPTGEA